MTKIIPVEHIASRIYFICGQKVMLDRDLAELYGVETRILTQAVRRNKKRFPADFMFVLKEREFNNLRSQIVISSWGGSRYLPMAFTEHGAIMAATVLNSQQAVAASIFVVWAFVRLRELLAAHKEFTQKLNEIEKRLSGHDKQFQVVFEAIKQLIAVDEKPKRKIGF